MKAFSALTQTDDEFEHVVEEIAVLFGDDILAWLLIEVILDRIRLNAQFVELAGSHRSVEDHQVGVHFLYLNHDLALLISDLGLELLED